MPEYIPNSQFEEELLSALETPTMESIASGIDAVPIVPAATAESEARIEQGGSLQMDLHLVMTTPTGAQWVREFKEASPSVRAVMLSQVMDAFNDGQEGIDLSFSEPVIK